MGITLAIHLFSQVSSTLRRNVLMYLWAGSVPLLYVLSVLFGLGLGAEMSGFPIINWQYYGAAAPLSTIHAWQWAGGMVGMALGGWLGGVLFDITGTFTWSIWLAALASLATLPSILSLPGKRARQPIFIAETSLQPA